MSGKQENKNAHIPIPIPIHDQGELARVSISNVEMTITFERRRFELERGLLRNVTDFLKKVITKCGARLYSGGLRGLSFFLEASFSIAPPMTTQKPCQALNCAISLHLTLTMMYLGGH